MVTWKVSYMQARKTIPYIKRGRKVLFPTAEIEVLLREGYVPTRGSQASA